MRAGEEPATGFVAFTRCFHGRTFGALSLTSNPKYKEQFAPLLEDVKVNTGCLGPCPERVAEPFGVATVQATVPRRSEP